jgi:spermidine synthase
VAAGTSIMQFQRVPEYRGIHIDAVEIDPWVIKIAKMEEYFGLKEGPNLAIHIQDARPFLRMTEKRYDLVEIDMFQGGPFVPFYVTSVEFFQLVSDRMSDNGLAITNVLALSDEKLLVWCIVATMKAVFPSVYVVRRSSNYLVFAFKKETSLAEVRRRLGAVRTRGLEELAQETASKLVTPNPYPGTHVFTDDKADVARITFNMVRRYANVRRSQRRRSERGRSERRR